MPLSLVRRIFSSRNDNLLRSQNKIVDRINSLEQAFQSFSDDALKEKTSEFKSRLANGEKLDALLPEAFATVREAAHRVLGQRHFDVQLRGGIVLHQGKIAEMKTGEGKTLVATLPVYLNALTGKGVHVVTVNDYLAKRDSTTMGRIYSFLGLTVGCIVHGLSDEERRAAYNADITYGTNHEFGFDYLRDNMKFGLNELCQRPFNYAIIDEVDNILIDEARTPLIISGPSEELPELYTKIDATIPRLSPADYEKDLKNKTVTLTESGNEKMERMLISMGLLTQGSLYDQQNISLVHHINQALRAHKLFSRDVDYIVKSGKVIIIDEFTGRMMEGRRYSDGLHQALEAKEHVTVERENQTLATITFQNYFRLYPKLAGMTGTALTEANEFAEIYNLEVVEIPTNAPVIRKDLDDEIYRTLAEKYDAIIKQIKECRKREQPVLVGMVSIEKSEILSTLLKKQKIPHNVLNARYHEQEAAIIAQAGRPGAVTIATNMAGRGTDIQLGGNVEMQAASDLQGVTDEAARTAHIERIRAEVEAAHKKVREAGGLYVIGTERHEARRIDNQLRGRSGRQGDPGISKFFVSLEDDLMRVFGAEPINHALEKLGIQNEGKITNPWVSTAMTKAQEKIEAKNFDIRKNVLKFDNVMNDQRKAIYAQRREIMGMSCVTDRVRDFRHELIHKLVSEAIPPRTYLEQWDLEGLRNNVKELLALDLPLLNWGQEDNIDETEIEERIRKAADEKISMQIERIGEANFQYAEKAALLGVLDQSWREHLLSLDQLREGIHLRGYGQRDPFQEFSREAFGLFHQLLDRVQEGVTVALMHADTHLPSLEQYMALLPQELTELHGDALEALSAGVTLKNERQHPITNKFDPQDPNTWHSTPRNSPCPCGSGKKYKQCHGTN